MAANSVNNEAKESFISKVINTNPSAYLGCYDKKYIFVENGIQIAVSLTCPKNPVGGTPERESAFEEVHIETPSTEMSDEERNTINKLMEALGI